jgi:hypothetical protein
VSVIKDIISDRSPQLATEIALVLHSDPEGDTKLRQWGKEQAIKVVPIFRPKRSAFSPDVTLRQQLSASLLSVDPFQVTGPVSENADFFGRKNDALDFLRQLESGRIKAIFGIRKVGKTSFINRIISLARDKGSPRIAMIDCSLKEFNKLDAQNALRVLAKVSKLAANQGYAHVSEAFQKSKDDLMPVFSDLWLKETVPSLSIIFDEIDYITPSSPTSPHWADSFNEFWCEFRVLVQEAQRHGVMISILVSGVSSKYFREVTIGGIENSALYFIPDEYLPPFSRGASTAMIAELSKRCGLVFTPDARDEMATICADLPFWIRMAGSYIHRSIELDSRPQNISLELVKQLLNAFIGSDGIELARVALQHLQNVYPEVIDLLRDCVSKESLSIGDGRLLIRYGLAIQNGLRVVVKSELIKAGLEKVQHRSPMQVSSIQDKVKGLSNEGILTDEWVEELALINRRRNQLERSMRQLIRFTLKVEVKSGQAWSSYVLNSLSQKRRDELSSLAASALMDKLFWYELYLIIDKNWIYFEKVFGDRKRLGSAMKLINDRPDAHAKQIDLADVALYRRDLTWLDDRVNS